MKRKKLHLYYNHLSHGGHSVHYDVVVSSVEHLEKWYLSLWRQWIQQYPDRERRKELFGIPDQYKSNRDNVPDTLNFQLEALEQIGFKNVDCYFKYGIFSLFGGSK